MLYKCDRAELVLVALGFFGAAIQVGGSALIAAAIGIVRFKGI